MLRLEFPLPDLPEIDGLPVLEIDVLRDPCSLPEGSGVVPREENFVSVGEAEYLIDELPCPPRSKLGISMWTVLGVRNMRLIRQVMGRTSFDFIRFCIVPDEWSLGLRDLHQAILLNFGQRDILLIPL